MSNQQILERAIKKAIDGGWRPYKVHGNIKDYKKWFFSTYKTDFIESESLLYDPNDSSETTISIWEVIFSHDFAKALWGDGKMSSTDGLDAGGRRMFEPAPIGDWKSHLREMVIAEDPIKYLGENI